MGAYSRQVFGHPLVAFTDMSGTSSGFISAHDRLIFFRKGINNMTTFSPVSSSSIILNLYLVYSPIHSSLVPSSCPFPSFAHE